VNKHNDLVVRRRMDALERNSWNISRAARELGLTTQGLKGFLDGRGLQFPRRKPARPRSVKVRGTESGLEKFCAGCSQWLPLEAVFFHQCATGASGYANRCKACAADRRAVKKAVSAQ
jgi:hypothetical protein